VEKLRLVKPKRSQEPDRRNEQTKQKEESRIRELKLRLFHTLSFSPLPLVRVEASPCHAGRTFASEGSNEFCTSEDHVIIWRQSISMKGVIYCHS